LRHSNSAFLFDVGAPSSTSVAKNSSADANLAPSGPSRNRQRTARGRSPEPSRREKPGPLERLSVGKPAPSPPRSGPSGGGRRLAECVATGGHRNPRVFAPLRSAPPREGRHRRRRLSRCAACERAPPPSDPRLQDPILRTGWQPGGSGTSARARPSVWKAEAHDTPVLAQSAYSMTYRLTYYQFSSRYELRQAPRRRSFASLKPLTVTVRPSRLRRQLHGSHHMAPHGSPVHHTTWEPFGTRWDPYGTGRQPHGTTWEPYGTTCEPYGMRREPNDTTWES
jgi:hypothetical protein